MNIKAKPNWDTAKTVRILSFVPLHSHDIYAVYVDEWGRIDTCLSHQLTIIDPEYKLEQPRPSVPKTW